jgi:hypothetical protein
MNGHGCKQPASFRRQKSMILPPYIALLFTIPLSLALPKPAHTLHISITMHLPTYLVSQLRPLQHHVIVLADAEVPCKMLDSCKRGRLTYLKVCSLFLMGVTQR